MAAAILDEPPKPDVAKLRARIATLENNRREDDPAWWNDLAGAHIRLGESQRAIDLLEPLLKRFPKDYGVRANLGTAYHLLGRYRDAEREIARDLEINPKAHFGLERYHLALLQYLIRDAEYQARHVYIDEWTEPFQFGDLRHGMKPGGRLPASAKNAYIPVKQINSKHLITLEERRTSLQASLNEPPFTPERRALVDRGMTALKALEDRPAPYRYRWDLAEDEKFTEGVIYMTSLNREQPACWVMLGIASNAKGDLHLGISAFQRALELGSPQSELLRHHISNAKEAMRYTDRTPNAMLWGLIAAGALPILVPLALWYLLRGRHKVRRLRARGRPTLPLEGS